MTSDDTSSLAYSLVVLMMVISALAVRRMPLTQTFKMAGAWIGIFAVIFVLFSFRGEAVALWQRLTSDINPSQPALANGTVRIAMSEGGHFYVDGELNGRSIRFLIDSGATTTSLSIDAAKSAGVDVSMSGFPVAIETANGVTSAWRAEVKRLAVGSVVRDNMPVLVSESFGETNMLGMDFLSSLKGWRVEGQTMILNP